MAKTKKAEKEQEKVVEETTENPQEQPVNEEETTETTSENPEEVKVEVEEAPAENLSAEQEDFRDRYIRLMAEFDNFRKRTQREKADLIRFGSKDLMTALLPVLDDLDRTLEAIEKTDNLTSVKDGVALVAKNIHNVFKKQGLEPIEAKGTDFDSELHEAISSFDMGEEKAGKVVEEVEKGYRFKEQVIRYSKVIVGE